jgi:CHASE1-domain containing sensor protein
VAFTQAQRQGEALRIQGNMTIEATITSILIAVSVGLLLLYLQQLAKVNELRAEAKSRSEQIEKLSASLKKSAEQFEDAIRGATAWYEQKIQDVDAQRAHYQTLFSSAAEVTRAISKAYTELHDMKFPKTASGKSATLSQVQPGSDILAGAPEGRATEDRKG